jgi:cell division protein ZapA
MPLVNVMVNGRAYTIACDDGEEDHLRQLSTVVDSKVRELLGSVGNVGPERLLLMAALLIADEHHGGRMEADRHAAEIQARSEMEARVKAAESQVHVAMEQVAAEGELRGELEARIKAAEDQAAQAMEQTAAKLERIAASLAAA